VLQSTHHNLDAQARTNEKTRKEEALHEILHDVGTLVLLSHNELREKRFAGLEKKKDTRNLIKKIADWRTWKKGFLFPRTAREHEPSTPSGELPPSKEGEPPINTNLPNLLAQCALRQRCARENTP
jgi:hypothetical protein